MRALKEIPQADYNSCTTRPCCIQLGYKVRKRTKLKNAVYCIGILSTVLCCVATVLMVLTVPQQAEEEGHGNWGWTPLHRAALHNQIEVVKLLLSHGADIDAADCKASPA